MWLLSSKENKVTNELDLKIKFSNHVIYTNEQFFEYQSTSFHVVVFGNLWPRYDKQKEPIEKNNFNWLISFMISKQLKFIDYVKGDFTIFVEIEKILYILNDHFGFSPIYINTSSGHVSNSFNSLKIQDIIFDNDTIAQHILYNRTVGQKTFDKNIENKEGANLIEFSNNHYKCTTYWDIKNVFSLAKKTYKLQDIIDFSIENISFFYKFFDVNKTFITLTGGKDSRSALAILLNQGIKPIGINYGSSESKDIVFAKKLAETIGIECKTIHVKTDTTYYYSLIQELMIEHPMTSIHRAHRYASFKEIQTDQNEFNVLFNGYLGGELLMGIYPDKLVFTEYVLNKIGQDKIESFKNYFETDLTKELINQHIKDESLIKNDVDAIFRIGLKHHLQDIHLSKKYCKYVYPFFLDIDFIERIFNSNYNFTKVNNKSKNLLKRHNLYELNCELQFQASPKLKHIPFAKKGNYTLNDYKKGPVFWSIKKVFNHLRERKYPPNFEYDNHYRNWITEELEKIILDKKSEIHNYFLVTDALNTIKNSKNSTFSESEALKFTRICMFYNYLSK